MASLLLLLGQDCVQPLYPPVSAWSHSDISLLYKCWDDISCNTLPLPGIRPILMVSCSWIHGFKCCIYFWVVTNQFEKLINIGTHSWETCTSKNMPKNWETISGISWSSRIDHRLKKSLFNMLNRFLISVHLSIPVPGSPPKYPVHADYSFFCT